MITWRKIKEMQGTVYIRFSGGITVDYRELQLVERTSQKHFYQLGEKDQPNSYEKHKIEKACSFTLGGCKEKCSLSPPPYNAPFLSPSPFTHPLTTSECEFPVSRGFVCLIHC